MVGGVTVFWPGRRRIARLAGRISAGKPDPKLSYVRYADLIRLNQFKRCGNRRQAAFHCVVQLRIAFQNFVSSNGRQKPIVVAETGDRADVSAFALDRSTGTADSRFRKKGGNNRALS